MLRPEYRLHPVIRISLRRILISEVRTYAHAPTVSPCESEARSNWVSSSNPPFELLIPCPGREVLVA
jgi:hypothetical protein